MKKIDQIIKRDKYYPGIGALFVGLIFFIFSFFSMSVEYKYSDDYIAIIISAIFLPLGVFLIIRAYLKK